MEEVVEFRHSPFLPGVGVLHAHYSQRKWHMVNAAVGLAVPSDWVGELRYRGKQQVFQAGDVFCTEAGEVHETSRVMRGGAFKALLIEERPLLELVADIAPQCCTTPSAQTAAARPTAAHLNANDAPLAVELAHAVLPASATPTPSGIAARRDNARA